MYDIPDREQTIYAKYLLPGLRITYCPFIATFYCILQCFINLSGLSKPYISQLSSLKQIGIVC